MPRSIAGYYLDELYNWKDSLIFHLEETEELEEMLAEVLHLNTLENIAARVEHHLSELNIIKQILHTLKRQVELLHMQLQRNQQPLSNDQVTEEMKENQRSLRAGMLKGEKDFLDIRYRGNEFIAEAIGRQHISNH